MHAHDRGLIADLPLILRRGLMDRRHLLGLLGAAGLATIVGCSKEETPSAGGTLAPSTPATNTGTPASASCDEIAQETAGPFPGDGSNGPNVLNESGVVRSDIRSSFGGMSGRASGVPLTVNLTIVDSAKSCAALTGAAVYLWHCDAEGLYSLYSQGATDQNYLRGVQEADASGTVTFQSVFPGAYQGRWPHIHFEVFPTLAKAAKVGNKVSTSQLAFPAAPCREVYASDGYPGSAQNFSRTSLERDGVFADGASSQLAVVSGSVTAGYVANLTVPV